MTNRKIFYLFAGLNLAISYIVFKYVFYRFNPFIGSQIDAAYGIVSGTPHWRLFQSRIIGPYLIEGISLLTNAEYAHAFLAVSFFLFSIFFVGITLLAFQVSTSYCFVLLVNVIACGLCLVVIRPPWLYPCDLVDLSVFTALCGAILTRQKDFYFVIILLIETFNREIVAVIGCWLTLESLIYIKAQTTQGPQVIWQFRWRTFVMYTLLTITSYLIIELVRTSLLRYELGPILFPWMSAGGSEHNFNIFIFYSFEVFTSAFSNPIKWDLIIYSLLIVSLFLLILRGLLDKNITIIRMSNLHLFLFILTVVMGFIYEPRVWISFIPFMTIMSTFIIFNTYFNSELRSKID